LETLTDPKDPLGILKKPSTNGVAVLEEKDPLGILKKKESSVKSPDSESGTIEPGSTDLPTPAAKDTKPSEKPTEESPGILSNLKSIWDELVKDYNTPETQARPEDPLVTSVKRGLNLANQAEIVSPFKTPTKDDFKELATIQRKAASLPASKEYQKFSSAETFGDALKSLKENPVKIIAELTGESLASLASYGASRVAAGAGMGAAAGSVVPGIGTAAGAGSGLIVGLADTSLALEYSSKFIEVLKEQGVDVTDEKSLESAFSNEEIISKARESAYKKSIPIAIFDLISGGIAGKVVKKPAASLIGKAGTAAAEFATQAALGGGGELAGQVVAGEKVQPGAILGEMIGEFGTTPVEVAANTAGAIKQGLKPTTEVIQDNRQAVKSTTDPGIAASAAQIVEEFKKDPEGAIAQATGQEVKTPEIQAQQPSATEGLEPQTTQKDGEVNQGGQGRQEGLLTPQEPDSGVTPAVKPSPESEEVTVYRGLRSGVNEEGGYKAGKFVTTDKDNATRYSKNVGEFTIPANLKILKYDSKEADDLTREFLEGLGEDRGGIEKGGKIDSDDKSMLFTGESEEVWVDFLKSKGYDATSLENSSWGDRTKAATEIHIFDPKQIKSKQSSQQQPDIATVGTNYQKVDGNWQVKQADGSWTNIISDKPNKTQEEQNTELVQLKELQKQLEADEPQNLKMSTTEKGRIAQLQPFTPFGAVRKFFWDGGKVLWSTKDKASSKPRKGIKSEGGLKKGDREKIDRFISDTDGLSVDQIAEKLSQQGFDVDEARNAVIEVLSQSDPKNWHAEQLKSEDPDYLQGRDARFDEANELSKKITELEAEELGIKETNKKLYENERRVNPVSAPEGDRSAESANAAGAGSQEQEATQQEPAALIRENGNADQSKQAVDDLGKLNLTHVSGLGMGQNQAKGSYVSTEKEGNRYETQDNKAKTVKVSVNNPFVTTGDVFANIQRAVIKQRFGKESIDDLTESEVDLLAAMMTEHFTNEGYDSIYFPESETQEGELIVFDRNKVDFNFIDRLPPTGKDKSVVPEEGGKRKSGTQIRSFEPLSESEARNQVSDVVKQNPVYYDTVNSKDIVDQATENIVNAGGIDAHYDTLIGKSTLEDIPVRQVERMIAATHYGDQMSKAIKDGDQKAVNYFYDRVNALQERIALDGAKTGQGSWAISLWKSMDPTTWVNFFSRKIDVNNEKVLSQKLSDGSTVGQVIETGREALLKLAEEEAIKVTDSDDFKAIVEKIVQKRLKEQADKPLRVRKATQKLKDASENLRKIWEANKIVGIAWDPKSQAKRDIMLTNALRDYLSALINKILVDVGEGVKNLAEQVAENARSFISTIPDMEVKDDDLKTLIDEEMTTAIEKKVKLKDVQNLVKQHYTDKEQVSKTIAEKLIKEYNLSESDAKSIEAIVSKAVANKLRKVGEKQLTKTMGTSKIPIKKSPKDVLNKINEAINKGALDSEFYQQLFAENFGLVKPLTAQEAEQLRKLSTAVQKANTGSLLEQKAVIEMAKFMDSKYPQGSAVDTFFALAYASMLSGMTTTALNLASTGFNIGNKPFRDLVNVTKWFNAAQKGIKEKSLLTFYDYSPLAEVMYVPQAMGYGAAKGARVFGEIWANGDVDNKYIEQIKRNKTFAINPLEKKPFKQVFITTPWRKVDLNVFNYYKYSGRNLAAQDRLMFYTANEFYIAMAIRDNYMNKGLRGKALRTAVMNDLLGKTVDMAAVESKLQDEIKLYEDNTGQKVTPNQANIQRQFLVQQALNLPKEQVKDAADLAANLTFTDVRGGIIANLSNFIGNIIGKNKATAILLKPHIPFTRVVGNVAEAGMDYFPFYGFARANGLGFTGIFNKVNTSLGGDPIATSQMGPAGSNKYYEQMARAWFGTMMFTSLYMLFVAGDDDDDNYLDITGGGVPDEMSKQYPKYMIKIGDFKMTYQNFPPLAVPLSILGGLKDQKRWGKPDDSELDRWALALLSSFTMIKDMSFVESARDLIDTIAKIGSFESNKLQQAGKELYRKYVGLGLKPLPQNTAMVQQAQQFLDPKSYSSKTIGEITNYTLGLHHFTNNPNVDLFGDDVKLYPSEGLVPYTHWVGLREKDPQWKFLFDNSINPRKITNSSISIWNKSERKIEYRPLEPDELYKYMTTSGKKFRSDLADYMRKNESKIDAKKSKIIEVEGKQITQLQKEVLELWRESKSETKQEMFGMPESVFDKLDKFNKKAMEDVNRIKKEVNTKVSIFD